MKISPTKVCTIISSLVLVVTSSAFADDFHYINMLVGNRASGLGGAYTAISDDPAGCYYNPAGIAFAPDTSISASVNAFNTSRKVYKNALFDVNGRGEEWGQESSSLLPNFFGIIRKLGSGMLGLSYAVPDSIQRRQKDTFYDINLVSGNSTETYTINMNDTDKTYLFGPSYAIELSDSFSVGATLYLYYRDMEVIRNELLQFEQGQHYLVNYYETKTDKGYKPIIGAIWEPLDKLAIGLTFSKIYVSSSDNTQQTILRNTLSSAFSNTNTISLQSSMDSEKDKFPLTTSLGVAYFASPKLLLSGDIRYYEEVSGKEGIYNLSLGTEYYFTHTLAARAGFYTDRANTPELSSGQVNQQEHIDIYGAALSLSLFHRTSSITLGMSYGFGNGDAQVRVQDPAIQDVEVRDWTTYISASYSY